jgi:hypothetical protein
MIWYRLSGASSLGLLRMIEHYRKRIEASRYLNIAGWLELKMWGQTFKIRLMARRLFKIVVEL